MSLGYAAIAVPAFVFVRILVPETKGRSLEEIEEALQRKSRRGAPRAATSCGTGLRPEGSAPTAPRLGSSA